MKEDTINQRVSRRTLLGGMVAAAVAPSILTKAWAQPEAPRMQVGFITSPGAACTAIPRYQHASASLGDGRILVAGGWRHSGLPAYVPPLNDAQIYDPGTNTWIEAAPLKMGRAQHAAVTLADGRILVVGGMNSAPLAGTEIYDPAADTWTLVAPMAQSRCGHSAACEGGLVIVTGGFNQGPLASIQIYDVAADAWHLAH